MSMSQIGREHRQALFDINTGSVPMKKRGHRKSMAKIMNAWTAAIPDFSKTDLTGELDESPSDHTAGERYSLIGQEKSWVRWIEGEVDRAAEDTARDFAQWKDAKESGGTCRT